MRLETEWFDYESDDRDAEIARNLKRTAESVRDLATYVAGESRQQCHKCGNVRACRPLVVEQDGHPVTAPSCAPCQEEYVKGSIRRFNERTAEVEDTEADQDNPDGDLPVEPEDGE